ncbi:alanine racemase [Pedobacter lusitanus]|uniref:Pyridoxal phosphate homeostasis protein n=1 Tax=Pedobacter lusitanus TaxID=1503925 RepID=A0A0D0GH81_9SPHI|nr:YggS family pyridoxal phosphate-dependent enzyme [Pedobacter lusitanus]KIO76647.1 alanine racemase [Pedobacter lusitanus]
MQEIIENNLKIIHHRIERACLKAGRNPAEVKLLLATKTVPADRIRVALQAGEILIAENKVQELKEKYEDLKDIPHQAHFIGHLQTNKIKDVLKYVSCIQSVDRIELVQQLDKRLLAEGRTLDILVQVNTSYEESKFGLSPDQAMAFIKETARYDTLRIKGLMTIGLFDAEAEKVRPSFRLLRTLLEQIRQENILHEEKPELSMGMSGDLETAIEEGATIVRIGTAVFGARMYPDSYYWNES